MLDDTELLQAWRAGDSMAGQTLFKRHYVAVTRFFANKLHEPPGDLVQETFVRCVESRDRIPDGVAFRSYLFGVAYRVFIAHLRRKYRTSSAQLGSVTILELDSSPSTLMVQAEELRLLLHALRRLPIEMQVIIELRYWEQMNSTEIAHALDAPPATIRTRLRKGRIMLEEAMREIAGDSEVVDSTLDDLDGWARKVRESMPSLIPA